MRYTTGEKKPPPSRRASAISAGVFGLLMGGVGGALIGAALDGTAAVLAAAAVSAVLFALGESTTDWFRRPGRQKPFLYRLLVATWFGAVLGAVFQLLFRPTNLPLYALVIAVGFGLMTLQLKRILVAAIVGLAVAFAVFSGWLQLEPVGITALVIFLYTLFGDWLAPRKEVLTLAAERVPVDDVPYVVPFEADTGYVGIDYFRNLAAFSGAGFARNPEDIGLFASLDVLRGPSFDPHDVDARIRDFYEHTSRYKLNIVPEWRQHIKPLFWLYKRFVAQPIGQANLPFNTEEAQRGVVSYIDTIDYDCNDIVDLRAWVRAFEATGEAIYVGAYTTMRHDDRGYVSVGFPLPAANFTATLLPYNLPSGGLLLKTRDTGLEFPGHYLSFVNADELTVMRLPALHEEIEVYLKDDGLRTDHRFYLGDLHFLTLYYTMERTLT